MSKNVKIDGRELSGVTAIKALDTDTNELVSFVDTSDADAAASDISAGKTAYVNGEKITGNNTGVEPNDLDGLVDGSITAFTMPTGKTKIAPYRFYQFVNLLSANLGGAVEIGNYAFDGCTKLAGLSLPSVCEKVGDYAFRSVGSGQSAAIILSPAKAVAVGQYGFYGAKISKVAGKFGAIGNYGFGSISALAEIAFEECGGVGDYCFSGNTGIKKITGKLDGTIGAYAFQNLYNVNECDFSEFNAKSLGNYAFSQFGGNRTNPDQNILTVDLSNSSFSKIPQYAFGTSNSSNMYKSRYMRFFFPKKVNTIEAYAFRYSDNCEFYFASENPPTLSATTAWDNATNYKIFVPFGSINAYRTATNWTAQVDKMTGYIAAGSLPVGSSLPTLGAEGYALTWYSDKACTVSATTVEDENAIYYCTAGTEKLGYGIKSITAIDCSITISDGTKNYIEGEGVPEGTVLTITGVPAQSGYVPYMFKVNDQNFTSGGTFTMNSDLSITAIYYDGQNIPASPVFNDNSWVIIREAFRSGLAATLWAVGDTKEVELNDGNTYHIRIADMQDGRYNLADGSGSTKGVLEFVECLPNYYAINPSQITDGGSTAYTAGGWAKCYMKNTVLDTTVWGWLPDDMRNAISEIALNEYSYTGESPRVSNNKLFLPAETEIFASRHSSAEGYQTGCVKYDRWDVYASITTSDGSTCVERQKKRLGQTSTAWWWLRSPCSGNSYSFCIVSGNGYYGTNSASYAGGVSPCFAI